MFERECFNGDAMLPSLIVISPAPASIINGKTFLDKKFVEGMQAYAARWDGSVKCLLRFGRDVFPYGDFFELGELNFEIMDLQNETDLQSRLDTKTDIFLASADDEAVFDFNFLRSGATNVCYVIEYTPEIRYSILRMENKKCVIRKIYSFLWIARKERLRRIAFRHALAIQANGYPAYEFYKELNKNTIMYLDSRIKEHLLASEYEMNARDLRLKNKEKLNIVYSGRLERMKGAQDIIKISRIILDSGVDFELNIFGSGSLSQKIEDDISKFDLKGRVALRGAVDFETELVPFVRSKADLYLSCHRQADPSCTYLESMGCGVAIAGYSNRMWSELCRQSGGGWAVPLGDVSALARSIVEMSGDRPALAAFCKAAREFAGRHLFEQEFEKRVAQLEKLVD